MTIKAGDWVMVVRGHGCVVHEIGGIPFTVSAVSNSGAHNFRCARCGKDPVHGPSDFAEVPYGLGPWRIPVSWLKKLDPDAERETLETRKEVTA